MPELQHNNIWETALSLGGNIGDTTFFFDFAAAELAAGGMTGIRRSRIIRTAPVNCVPGTPDFLNTALTGTWHGTPLELLRLCQNIEQRAGRPAEHSSREARVLDCDIILCGGIISSDPRLILPHPRARERRFVLEVLAELIPERRFPDTGETVAEALSRLP